ncbi:hypothetical protein T265_09216, partial [Opisthorchis viverrini]
GCPWDHLVSYLQDGRHPLSPPLWQVRGPNSIHCQRTSHPVSNYVFSSSSFHLFPLSVWYEIVQLICKGVNRYDSNKYRSI